MRRLDRTRDYGQVCPPEVYEKCDRPTHFEQDGFWFDAFDREIIPGKPLNVSEMEPRKSQSDLPDKRGRVKAAPEPEPDPAEAESEGWDPGHLAANVDTMAWSRFRAEAKKLLGKKCPKVKPDIIDALKKAAGRSAKSVETAKNGMTWDKPPPKDPEPEKAPAVTAPPAAKGKVDLAAWARGKKEVLWGEVLKELRASYKVQFSNKRDAVNFLIDQGVVTGAQARRDV